MYIKYLIIFIIVTNSFASSVFWNKVQSIENSFYIEIPQNYKDKNATINTNNVNSMLDKKYDSFNELIILLKEKPYDLTLPSEFDTENANNQIIKLQERIKINQTYSNDLAVIRDTININNILLKIKIKSYFISLADNWTSYDEKSIDNLNNEYKKYLVSIKYSEFLELYNRLRPFNGEVEDKTKETFVELNKHYQFFNDILIYIEANKPLFAYESLTSFLKLDKIIKSINSHYLFAELNPYLRFIYVDAGRLILFILSVATFFLLNYLIYKIIYGYLKKILLIRHNEINENILENLDKIRKPVSYIVIIIGLKLALDILIYPNSINEQLSNIIYFICILLSVYVANILIDVYIYSYLVKHESNAENIRKELIKFSKSIAKVIIFFTVFLVFLMKMGVNISAILASLGIGGLAIALAAQTTLSNFFGLLKIMMDNSFSQGDWIETTDVRGTVVEIGFISTTIRTFDNAIITVPNSTLANSSITNWNKRKLGRRVKMYIALTYSSKKENIHRAIKQIEDMLIAHIGVATEEEVNYEQINKNYKKEQRLISVDDKYGIKSRIYVYLDRLSDSSMDILVDFFTKDTDVKVWLKTKEEVIFNIWGILEENDLEFAFPSQTLYLKNLEKTKEIKI